MTPHHPLKQALHGVTALRLCAGLSGLSQKPPGHLPFAGSARTKPRRGLADPDGLTGPACLLQWEAQALGAL